MKAIVLSIKHRNKLKAALANLPLTSDFRDSAIKWLTYGSKDVNPFDVFEPHEKDLIVEALEHAAASYRQAGEPYKLEQAHRFEQIAHQALAVARS